MCLGLAPIKTEMYSKNSENMMLNFPCLLKIQH